MDLALAGDTALCTAATDGLGYACAQALVSEGANVAVCGRTPERVDRAQQQLSQIGSGEAIAIRADITEPEDITAFVDQTRDQLGTIDHLVTSAGGPPSGPFAGTSPADWQAAYEQLVMSVVWTLEETLADLTEDGGTWTAITSRTVQEVADDLVLSNAVRRAVIGLVKTCSREYAPALRANAVLPGPHETARIRELIEDAVERGDVPDYDAGYQEWAEGVPLERLGEPEELGEVVAFLASRRASYVNGAALPIDGGALRSV